MNATLFRALAYDGWVIAATNNGIAVSHNGKHMRSFRYPSHARTFVITQYKANPGPNFDRQLSIEAQRVAVES